MDEQIVEVLVPTEEVVELRRGQKINTERKVVPGLVLVKMDLPDETWHLVKNTPKVTGFVGAGKKPTPLTQEEVDSILNRVVSTQEKPKPKHVYEHGEHVRIIDGPFANFSGKVDEVNPERNTLRVLVTIFGRATPVELGFSQVEKT